MNRWEQGVDDAQIWWEQPGVSMTNTYDMRMGCTTADLPFHSLINMYYRYVECSNKQKTAPWLVLVFIPEIRELAVLLACYAVPNLTTVSCIVCCVQILSTKIDRISKKIMLINRFCRHKSCKVDTSLLLQDATL